MKQKLTETYLPDKSGRAEKVVVALSGGLDSYIAAYLLKIQKFDLIGVTVLINWEKGLSPQENYLSCSMDETRIASIKDFCHQLNIPHHSIKASEFPEAVVEKWVASRVTGSLSNACWSCHDLRMNLVYEKMLQLGIKTFATGHYAKVFHHETHKTAYVHTSNEEQYDQSALLSRLPQEVLNHISLPLSDLTKKEVIKLAENFGLSSLPRTLEMHHCFPATEASTEYVLKRVPGSYQKRGELTLYGDDLTEHEGMLQWTYGQKIEVRDQPSQEFLMAGMIFSNKKVAVAPKDFFVKKRILLIEAALSEETPITEPLKGFIKTSECWIHPKELNSYYIEIDEPIHFWEGEIVTINRKRGKNAKVLLTGKVRFIAEEKVEPHEEQKNVKVDFSRDY